VVPYPKRVFRVDYCKEEKHPISANSTSAINNSTGIESGVLKTK